MSIPNAMLRHRVAALLDLNQFYTRTVLVGIRSFVRTRSAWTCEPLAPDEAPTWEWLSEGEWDGIITYATNPVLLKFLRDHRIPCVNVSNSLPAEEKAPRVVSDDLAVGRLVADHFFERGIRHFAFFGTNKSRVSHLRHLGFAEVLAGADFPCELLWPDFQIEKGRWLRAEIPQIKQRVIQGHCPLGVFCMNDTYARWLIGCCVHHGIQVPEQVAVVGVDNSEVADGMAEMPFSSVELQLQKIGYTAMEILAQMIAGGKVPSHPVLIAPKSVVTRASSDLLAIDDLVVVRALRLIRAKAYEPLQIEEIVKEVALSRRMLEKRFKAAMGRSPYAEVLRLRVERAKTLLAETDLPISEVAEASGFGEAKQLHAIFSRQVGSRPSTYRKSFQSPR